MAEPKESARSKSLADLGVQVLVVLPKTDPLVWRRIVVPADASFWALHMAIQDAMGWYDCHLHEFRLLDHRSGTRLTLTLPDPHGFRSAFVESVRDVFIWDFVQNLVPPFEYRYDLGDNWAHTVMIESLVEAEGRPMPFCLDGRSACPPEDCGGPLGYRRLLSILGDPKHPEHQAMMEWAEGPIDPFDWEPSDVVFDDPERRWRDVHE